MWNSATTKPESGKRIVSTYNDGSGAKLFAVVEDAFGDLRLIDEDGDEHDAEYLTACQSFDQWAYLPDGSKLWCELRSVEPINLSF
jgi:hypothetical protein